MCRSLSQGAHEFLCRLLELITDQGSLHLIQINPADDAFGFALRKHFRCDGCGNLTMATSPEPHQLFLTVKITDACDLLHRHVTRYFAKTKVARSCRQSDCRCTQSWCKETFNSLPRVLIVYAPRTHRVGDKNVKRKNQFHVGQKLNIGPFCRTDTIPVSPPMFPLHP